MKCSEARNLAVDAISRAAAPEALVSEHLHACPRCSRWHDRALLVHRSLRELSIGTPPEQLKEIVEEGIGDGLKATEGPEHPPAKAAPERSATQKAAIFILTLVALLAMMLLLMLGLRSEGEPLPQVADIVRQDGQCELRTPGTQRWRELGRGDYLPPGSQLRTGPDAIMVIGLAGAQVHLAPMTAVSVPGDGALELVVGRLYAEIDAEGDRPFEFITANGGVSCRSGAFTAAVTLNRLHIGCSAGLVHLDRDEAEEGPVLEPGDVAMMYEGEVSGPVRSTALGRQLHWLGMLREYEGGRLVPRQMALVAVTPDATVLPPAVAVERMQVAAFIRGPLAVLHVTLALHNTSGRAWEGDLSLRGAVLPPPLAAVDASALRLPPGTRNEVRLTALCALRNRSGYWGVGLNPRMWAPEVGQVAVEVDAAASGGMREFLAPTLRPRERGVESVAFRETYTDQRKPRPLVLEMRLRDEGADGIELSTETDTGILTASHLATHEDPWLSREKKVFIAFDATGDFGPGGRMAAHAVLEGLIGSLPPGATTALIAFDGRLKLDSDRLMLHVPARAEGMLDRLWHLEAPEDEGGQTGRFLAAALVPITGLDSESVTVLVTGRRDPGDLDLSQELLAAGRTRLAVIQVGADRPAYGYRTLCASTGGVVLAIPPAMAPELGVIDFLANLIQPTVCDVVPAGGILTGPADFANQPVIGLFRDGGPAQSPVAVVGDERVAVPLPPEGSRVPGLAPDEARVLLESLRALGAR